ncbi:hypothetical protein GCM10020256_17870 [Streptomyces thermocoprophilus]
MRRRNNEVMSRSLEAFPGAGGAAAGPGTLHSQSEGRGTGEPYFAPEVPDVLGAQFAFQGRYRGFGRLLREEADVAFVLHSGRSVEEAVRHLGQEFHVLELADTAELSADLSGALRCGAPAPGPGLQASAMDLDGFGDHLRERHGGFVVRAAVGAFGQGDVDVAQDVDQRGPTGMAPGHDIVRRDVTQRLQQPLRVEMLRRRVRGGGCRIRDLVEDLSLDVLQNGQIAGIAGSAGGAVLSGDQNVVQFRIRRRETRLAQGSRPFVTLPQLRFEQLDVGQRHEPAGQGTVAVPQLFLHLAGQLFQDIRLVATQQFTRGVERTFHHCVFPACDARL